MGQGVGFGSRSTSMNDMYRLPSYANMLSFFEVICPSCDVHVVYSKSHPTGVKVNISAWFMVSFTYPSCESSAWV